MKKNIFIIIAIINELAVFGQECSRVFRTNITYANPQLNINYTNHGQSFLYKVFKRTTSDVSNTCDGGLDIKKPIIICEGFDFTHAYDGDDIYYEFLNRDGYGDLLRKKGYDIIVYNINVPQSAIQPNAIIFSQFIEFINQNKTGNEENIIMGASLGGILARYALSYLEKNSKPHNTRLFISFDSPHQGANVPLSIQALMFNLNGMALIGSFFGRPELLNLYRVFISDGTLQLMSDHVMKISDGISYPHIHRVNFMNELSAFNNSFGYPQDCKKIAISDGSYRGDLQKPYNNNLYGAWSGNTPLMFRYTSWLGSFLLLDQAWKLRTSVGVDNFAYDDMDVCVLSHFGDCDILDANNKALYRLRNNQCPLDHSPGGYDPWFKRVYDEISKVSNISVYARQNDNACFVATTSALDLNTSDKLIKLKNYTKNQILTDTPFDDIWWDANQDNLPHTFLTKNMGAWLYQQIMEDASHYSGKESRVINNISINDNTVYKATNSIILQNSSVTTGKELSLVAGNTIEFLPGFESPLGSTLNAYVRSVSEPKRSLANRLPNFRPRSSARVLGNFDDFYSDTISSYNDRIPNKSRSNCSKNDLSSYSRELNVYPNPIIDYATLTIDVPEMGTIYIRLTNSVGSEVYSSVFEECVKGNNIISLNFSNVENGLYTMTINTKSKVYNKKIAVRK